MFRCCLGKICFSGGIHRFNNTVNSLLVDHKMRVNFQIAQLDEVKIRISALRAIVDLLLLFGFQLLSETVGTQAIPPTSDTQDDDVPQREEKGDGPEDTAQSILVMLTEMLGSEVRFTV